MKNRGFFVISLDFELLWGVFDKVHLEEKENYFINARKVVPEILSLFEKYEVHCTWAIVGMLFNKDWKEWEANQPERLPQYLNASLSPYEFGNLINTKETEPFVFAPELVQKIADTPFQEVGSHTYSHYYCLEAGQTIDDFEKDLKKSIEVASKINITIKSLVFPRNQFNNRYLKVCKDLGITSVRSNPESWYWKNPHKSSLLKKIFRTGDAYIGAGKDYNFAKLEQKENEPLAQMSSRLLRTFSKNSFINFLKLRKIKKEMTSAAKKKKVYHLWWHPHNFGENPKRSLEDLKNILEHYKYCQKEFGFDSRSMEEINQIFRERKS